MREKFITDLNYVRICLKNKYKDSGYMYYRYFILICTTHFLIM